MKHIFLILSSLLIITASSCKKKTEQKESEPTTTEKKEKEETYQVSSQGSEAHWTGYKFTNKTPVSGKFKTITVTKAPVGKTPLEAFNGVEFSIPASSIFSDNAIRDGKLANLFFGIMDQTEFLTGTFNTKGENVFLNLKMNGKLKEIPLKHNIADRHVRLQGTLNILDFGAEAAFNSIHKACEVLHTGTDNVSKTWEDVAIEAIVFLK